MPRKALFAVLLPVLLIAALVAAETGWLSRGTPALQGSVRDLPSGRPVPGASVVLVDKYWPPLGAMFASSDPQRCRSITFVRSDGAGQLPPDADGGVVYVSAPGVSTLAQYVSTVPDGARFALVTQKLQSSERAEPFGPGHASEAEANAARVAFLASPEGQDYTAFTVKPDGEDQYRNFRSLQVRWVEVARGGMRYATEAAAEEARRSAAWTLPGPGKPADPTDLLDALAFCRDARVRGTEVLGTLLDALAAVPNAQATVQHWRQRTAR